ncbi:MAG: hypothetical protein QM758_23875 [Armatimonas sp.]
MELRSIVHSDFEADLEALASPQKIPAEPTTDVAVEAGEQVEVYVFAENVEKSLAKLTGGAKAAHSWT